MVYDIFALWDGNVQHMRLMMSHGCLDAKSDPDFYCHTYICMIVQYIIQAFSKF
jgi:hypothetical protein